MAPQISLNGSSTLQFGRMRSDKDAFVLFGGWKLKRGSQVECVPPSNSRPPYFASLEKSGGENDETKEAMDRFVIVRVVG